MADNRLAIVVDGTEKMAYYWQSIYNNFLQRIVRNFCQNESTAQDPYSSGNYALGLIVYFADDSLNACPVQPSAWTKDMDIFLQWLSGLSFNGSGQNEAPIAEGLSNALMMFPLELGRTQTRQLGKRHCVLVAANNPLPLPRAVLLPKIKVLESGEISETKIECHNVDAEAVARSFPQSFVSLSVICPRQFPKLREIYNAGNISQQAAGSSTDYRHPQLLVLISKSFVEAHAALKQLETENRLRFRNEPDLISPFSDNFSEDDIKKLRQIFEPSKSDQEVTQVDPRLSKLKSGNNLASMDSDISGNMTDSQPSGVETAGPEDFQKSQRAGRTCGAQMAKDVNRVKQRRFEAIDQMNIIPRPSVESVSRDVNNQARTLYSEAIAARYIKAWEGGITSKEHGQIMLINTLVVYRRESQSEKIFARWPRILHLDHLIFWDCFSNIAYHGAIECLTIDEIAPCSTLDQMEEKRLSAYIKLPQHTLILSNTNKKMRFIGQLYKGVYPLMKHQIYSPEQ